MTPALRIGAFGANRLRRSLQSLAALCFLAHLTTRLFAVNRGPLAPNSATGQVYAVRIFADDHFVAVWIGHLFAWSFDLGCLAILFAALLSFGPRRPGARWDR